MAQHQRGGVVTHRDLDLRQAAVHREPFDQRAQRIDERRDAFGQHRALVHVGDVGGAALAKAHHHALLVHAAHREPRPVPVAPFVAADHGQDALGLDFANARQVLQQPVLLGSHLRGEVGVLRGAAAADAEMRAARRAPAGRFDQQAADAPEIETTAAGHDLHGGALAGQRAVDEQHLAVRRARDAAPLGVQAGDIDRQLCQSDRNSCQCGSGRRASR